VTATLDLSKLALVAPLGGGKHEAPGMGAPIKGCVMEIFSFVRGIAWTDSPPCVSGAVAAFMRNWNDHLPDDETRNRLLLPLLPDLADTATTPADEQTRAFLAMDWLLREFAPAWLDLVPALAPHASALRQAREVTSVETLTAASGVAASAATAARAARDAAWAAAWAAARAAAWDAAWAAAGARLAATAARLQESAQGLVRRMCAVGRALSPSAASGAGGGA
jgi:hypothetical protein